MFVAVAAVLFGVMVTTGVFLLVACSKEFSSAGSSYSGFKHKYVLGKRHDEM
eukprot:SAG22_NODE_526_length_9463_cov_8.286523_7_plen_52_part_00